VRRQLSGESCPCVLCRSFQRRERVRPHSLGNARGDREHLTERVDHGHVVTTLLRDGLRLNALDEGAGGVGGGGEGLAEPACAFYFVPISIVYIRNDDRA